jgi:glycosyltransferase involved in cell wall biosynthesis
VHRSLEDGFERFPWPIPEGEQRVGKGDALARLFMAAVDGDTIKGYHVAREACRILRQARSDFEPVVTFDPAGPIDEFTRSFGWCSLTDLPRHYREADICLVPTIAQDSLSRTSVEAMASGIAVIASGVGGLPYTVTDGITGLLFEPGDSVDLARKIARLLDDPDLRRRMGLAGATTVRGGLYLGGCDRAVFSAVALLGAAAACCSAAFSQSVIASSWVKQRRKKGPAKAGTPTSECGSGGVSSSPGRGRA